VREFQKNVVLTERLCYVSSITWSHAYCLAVEKMMGIETPERGKWIRVVALELQRIASHLMWLAAYGPDLGLLTGLLWALRERELFLDLIQLMSGARMNQNRSRNSSRSRSEEHTSELQSRADLVCRLLLEKKK